MGNQLNLFDGPHLRDEGIQRAVDHADYQEPKWSYKAYNFLRLYIQGHKVFMVEQLREASVGIVPEPPSKRAWGGVIVRAVKAGIVRRKGFCNVANPSAHCTPATVWEVV